jgi:hypothetical protein
MAYKIIQTDLHQVHPVQWEPEYSFIRTMPAGYPVWDVKDPNPLGKKPAVNHGWDVLDERVWKRFILMTFNKQICQWLEADPQLIDKYIKGERIPVFQRDYINGCWSIYQAFDTFLCAGETKVKDKTGSYKRLKKKPLLCEGTQNTVRVLQVKRFGFGKKAPILKRIQTIRDYPPSILNCNPWDNPYLFGRVRAVNDQNIEIMEASPKRHLTYNPYITLYKQWWADEKELIPIVLPRNVTVTDPGGVTARFGEKMDQDAGHIFLGETFPIYEIKWGKGLGGYWGRIDDLAWVPLQYKGDNPFDWKL